MIFALHAYSLLRDSLYSTINKEKTATLDNTAQCEPTIHIPEKMNPSAVLDEEGVKFSPPAYLQRYGDVCEIIKSDSRWAGQINKVVDFGCAELSFFVFLKSIPEIGEVLEVDYDGEILEQFCNKAKPLLYDYRIERTTPLNVSILQGSVSDPDSRLIGCDAVVCIELIEHLDPAILDRFPQNIFGFIKPYLVFVTTPNVEFNVLFPKLKNGGFRHYDHRFEWTRDQFEEWANNIVLRYPDYDVEYYGIAPGPIGTEHLGCCSQMALFINKNYHKDENHENINPITDSGNLQNTSTQTINCHIDEPSINEKLLESIDVPSSQLPLDPGIKPDTVWDWKNWEKIPDKEYYKLIANYVYPFRVDNRSREQKICDEAISIFNLLVGYDYDYFDENSEEWKVPLERLLPKIKDIAVDVEELGNILLDNGRKVKNGYLLFDNEESTSEEEDYNNAEDINNTAIDYKNCENLWVDEPLWDEEILIKETNNVSPAQEECSPIPVKCDKNRLLDYNIDNTSIFSHEMTTHEDGLLHHQTDVYTPLEMSESALGDIHLLGSSTEDGSLLNSPLARFYGPNGSSTDEQRLSDSGYLKSQQDSPQSPVCSDTFSNDLITPDKDYLEIQSTMLECIPENLNCLSSTSKDVTRLRRKSIGPGIESKHPEFNDGMPSSTLMSRPKSLNMCTTSPKSDIDESKRPNSVGSRSHPDRQKFNDFKPWSPISNDTKPEMIDMSPFDYGIEDAPMRQLVLDPPNVDRRVVDGFRMPERVVRPDFLDVQNVDFGVFQNGDRLNNNLDFEGNNFEGGEDADEIHFRDGGNIFPGEYMGDDRELLRLHLDRHNENHLILDQEIDRLVNEINHEIDHGEIVEDILEYQENNEANENDGFFKGNFHPGVIKDFSIPNCSELSNTKKSTEDKPELCKNPHKLCQSNKESDLIRHTAFTKCLESSTKQSSLSQTVPTDDDNLRNLVNFQAGCSKYRDHEYEPSCSKSPECNKLNFTRKVANLSENNMCDANNFEIIFSSSGSEINCLSEALTGSDGLISLENFLENESNNSLLQIESEDSSFTHDLAIPGCSFGAELFDGDEDEEIDSGLSLTAYYQNKDVTRLSLTCLKIDNEDSDLTITCSSNVAMSIVNIFPDWLSAILEMSNSDAEEDVVPPVVPFLGLLEGPQWGAGDGPGVHSVGSSTSSGISSGSVGDDPQLEPLDLFWVSSGGSVSNNSTPLHVCGIRRRLYDESSSSTSDTHTDANSLFVSFSSPLSAQDTTVATNSTHSSQVDLGISSTQSDASGNVADIEVDTESD